jgi:hypothetical protein
VCPVCCNTTKSLKIIVRTYELVSKLTQLCLAGINILSMRGNKKHSAVQLPANSSFLSIRVYLEFGAVYRLRKLLKRSRIPSRQCLDLNWSLSAEDSKERTKTYRIYRGARVRTRARAGAHREADFFGTRPAGLPVLAAYRKENPRKD